MPDRRERTSTTMFSMKPVGEQASVRLGIKSSTVVPTVMRMFETLAAMSGDELATMYGLLAESMLVAPDKSSITVRLNPKARFNNGDPVMAEDVIARTRKVS